MLQTKSVQFLSNTNNNLEDFENIVSLQQTTYPAVFTNFVNDITIGDSDANLTLEDDNSRVILGNGDNYVKVGNGDNEIQVGNGNNSIYTGFGNNQVDFRTGNNSFISNGHDTIYGMHYNPNSYNHVTIKLSYNQWWKLLHR